MQSGDLTLFRTNATVLEDDLKIMAYDLFDLLNNVTDAGFDARSEIDDLSLCRVRGSHIDESSCGVLNIRKVPNRVHRSEFQPFPGQGLTDDGRDHRERTGVVRMR